MALMSGYFIFRQSWKCCGFSRLPSNMSSFVCFRFECRCRIDNLSSVISGEKNISDYGLHSLAPFRWPAYPNPYCWIIRCVWRVPEFNMPFIRLPGKKGLFFVPAPAPACTKKHPCPDCHFCQNCGEERCRVCRRTKSAHDKAEDRR